MQAACATFLQTSAMLRPPFRARNAAPQPQRPITHLELFTGDDGSFGDGDAFVELLGGQLGALVLDGFCTPLKSAASGDLLSAGKSAVGRQISAFARSTAAARVRIYADADAELKHALQRAYRSQQLFTPAKRCAAARDASSTSARSATTC